MKSKHPSDCLQEQVDLSYPATIAYFPKPGLREYPDQDIPGLMRGQYVNFCHPLYEIDVLVNNTLSLVRLSLRCHLIVPSFIES